MSSRSFAILALLLGLFTGAWAAEPISGTPETSQGKPLKKIIIPRIINMPNWEHNIKKIIFKT